MSNRSDTAIYTAFDDHQKVDGAEPERNLMRSILQSAMDDMQRTGERYREARQYFQSSDDQYVFSFLSICYHLDLCAQTIRNLVGLASRGQMPGEEQVDEDEKIAA